MIENTENTARAQRSVNTVRTQKLMKEIDRTIRAKRFQHDADIRKKIFEIDEVKANLDRHGIITKMMSVALLMLSGGFVSSIVLANVLTGVFSVLAVITGILVIVAFIGTATAIKSTSEPRARLRLLKFQLNELSIAELELEQ